MNKLIKLMSLSSIITIPTFSVVSCSNTSTSNNGVFSQEKIEFDEYLKDSINLPLEGKEIDNTELKNILTLDSWTSFSTFKANIEKYFTLSSGFEDFLTKNNSKIFKSIKKINIQPIENQKSVKVIFYLNSSINDGNIVSIKVENALKNEFTYAKIYEIDLLDKKLINYISGTDADKVFKEEFENIASKNDLQIIKRVFSLKNDLDINDFGITYDSYRQIIISLTPKAINDGKIIKSKNLSNDSYSFLTSIKSFSVIK